LSMAFGVSHTAPPASGRRVWQFGECKFDELRHELRVRGQVVDIEGKPLEVLHQLLLRAGDVVSKEELLEAVWPGVSVVDASLATAVSKLRKALEDDTIIKTIPKVGYRFCGAVRCCTAGEPPPSRTTDDAVALLVIGTSQQRHFANRLSWSRGSLGQRILVGAMAAVVLLVIFAGIMSFRGFNRNLPTVRAVAILPFQNLGADRNLEYLRSALPDQVANSLSTARSLTIRPVAATGRYADPTLDLRQAGRELDVDRIVTGHYVLAGNVLQITMQAVDINGNRVLWQETLNVPANNLLQLQAEVAAASRGSLARALGITQFVSEIAPPPSNETAYELYLRSLALDWDPAPTREAIELLRKSVLLDAAYAPAWGQLSLRYYSASRFGGGGPEMLQLSDAAAERQMELEPDAPGPVAELTIHRTERGDLVEAHQQALELVRRRPDDPNNHHVLSYVLRYGGSLEEAGRECDMVVLLATKVVWGSCSTTFMELGNYKRAMDFVRKDLSSEWSKAHAIEVHLREGNASEAIRIGAPKIPHWDSYKMLLACAQHEVPPEIEKLAAGVEVDDDPEVNYFFAGHLAYCGQTDAALRMLKLAIERNYCSYPSMDNDPFFNELRTSPEFTRIRRAAIACHGAFVANRLQPPKRDVAELGMQN
jgi:DNA-binding winged helix-turn-helix (wHTH) protein/TolB-like protein